MVLVARRDHPLVHLRITLEDLRKEQFVAGHRRRETEHLPPPSKEVTLTRWSAVKTCQAIERESRDAAIIWMTDPSKH
jgi:hypothetical protein